MDLSHNPLHKLPIGFLKGIEEHLEELTIANISAKRVPELVLPSLVKLNLSSNLIKTFDHSVFYGLPNIKTLDLSANKLTKLVRSSWRGTNLDILDVSGNQIRSLFNDTFRDLENIRHLFLDDLPLSFFGYGSLSRMAKLTRLSVSTYRLIKGLRFARHTENNFALKELEISTSNRNLCSYLGGKLQRRLSKITITGKGLVALCDKLMRDLRSRHLILIITDTSVDKLTKKFFENLGEVRSLDLDVRRNSLTTMGRPYSSLTPGQVSGPLLCMSKSPTSMYPDMM